MQPFQNFSQYDRPAQYERSAQRLATTLVLVIWTLLAGVSCQKASSRSRGMIIVAVEGLKSDDLPCTDPQPSARSGFNLLCHEFLHVKGMVASSTSSVGSMSALLTGENPQDLNISTSNDFLSAKHETTTEKVHQKGWRTGYFFSSPPLSRRSGVSQGFDFIDEGPPSRRSFRVIEEVLASFRNWFFDDNARDFFSVVSLSDLLHPEIATLSDNGENRNQSVESQLDEMDESLFHFFDALKKTKRWETTWIVFVGLQGRADDREGLPRTLQMRPSHLVVPAFIKPAGKSASKKTFDTIEGTWTHADLGRLVREIVSEKAEMTMDIPTLAKRMTEKQPEFVSSRGCLSQLYAKPICRVAFFDQNAWLTWDKKISFEALGRKELFQKISLLPTEKIPERFNKQSAIHRLDWMASTTYDRCVHDFLKVELQDPFSAHCPSRPVQILREMTLGKSGDPRDLKNQFIRRWSELAMAFRIYQWNRSQQVDIMPNPEPYAEYLALEKILSRPEYVDLRRECEKSL